MNECTQIILAQVLLVAGGTSHDSLIRPDEGYMVSSTEVSLSSGKTLFCKQRVSRWPSIRVAANWSGGRRNSFLHQGADYKLPWSTVSSTRPVVEIMVATTSPRSSPGTQWPSLGRRLENLLWRDTGTQPSPFQLHLLDVNLIQNIKHHWQLGLGGILSQLGRLLHSCL